MSTRGPTQTTINATQGRINIIKDKDQCYLTLGEVSCNGSTRCYLCNLSIIPHTKTFRMKCIDEDDRKIDNSTQWVKERCSTDNDYPECEHIIPCISVGAIYGNPWELDIMLHRAVKARLINPQLLPQDAMFTSINTNNFLDSQMRINYAWAHKICNNLKSNIPLIHYNLNQWKIENQYLNNLLARISINQDWQNFYKRYYDLHNKPVNQRLINLVHKDAANNSISRYDINQMKNAAVIRLQLVCDLLNLPQFTPLIPLNIPTNTQNTVPRAAPSRRLTTQGRLSQLGMTYSQRRIQTLAFIQARSERLRIAEQQRRARQTTSRNFRATSRGITNFSPRALSPGTVAPASTRESSPVPQGIVAPASTPAQSRAQTPAPQGTVAPPSTRESTPAPVGGFGKHKKKYIENKKKYVNNIKKSVGFELFKEFILYLDRKKISLVYKYDKSSLTTKNDDLSFKSRYMKLLVFNNEELYEKYEKILSNFIKNIKPNIIRQELEIYDKYLDHFKSFIKSAYKISKELNNIDKIFSSVLLSYFKLSIAYGIIHIKNKKY